MIKIAVLTNDKAVWAVQIFSELFNKFWDKSQLVDVVGFNPPEFTLPDNFTFVSLDNNNWPQDHWTNQLMLYLLGIEDDHVILFLEDYWLSETVNIEAVNKLWRFCGLMPNMLRMDLTADRISHKNSTLITTYQGVNIYKTPTNTPYQMSYQAGIWNRRHLLSVLRMNENPWDSEVKGTLRLTNEDEVYCTNIHPVRYIPVLRRNKVGIQQLEKFDKDTYRFIQSNINQIKRG